MRSTAVFPLETINQQQIPNSQKLFYQQLANDQLQQRSIWKTRRCCFFLTMLVVLVALAFLVSFSSAAKTVVNQGNVTDTEMRITSMTAASTKIINTHASTEENSTTMSIQNTNSNNINIFTERESSPNPIIDALVVESSTSTAMT